MVGRETVFTLCDGTDRAIVTVDAKVRGSALVSDSLVIFCTTTVPQSSSRFATT